MEALLEYFRTFADPTRLKLLKLLSVQPLCVCNLVSALDMSQPAVSNQLARLKELGLVKAQRRSHWSFYYLDQAGLECFMQKWKEFWEAEAGELSGLEEEWGKYQQMLLAGEVNTCPGLETGPGNIEEDRDTVVNSKK